MSAEALYSKYNLVALALRFLSKGLDTMYGSLPVVLIVQLEYVHYKNQNNFLSIQNIADEIQRTVTCKIHYNRIVGLKSDFGQLQRLQSFWSSECFCQTNLKK